MINSIDLYLSSQSSCLSQVFSHSRNIINLKHKMTSKRHWIWVFLSFLSMTVNQLCGQCWTFILKGPAFSWQTACFYCVGGGAHRQTDSEGERARERLCLSLSGRSPLYMRLLPESGAVSCSPLSCREISPPQTLPLKVKLFLLLV